MASNYIFLAHIFKPQTLLICRPQPSSHFLFLPQWEWELLCDMVFFHFSLSPSTHLPNQLVSRSTVAPTWLSRCLVVSLFLLAACGHAGISCGPLVFFFKPQKRLCPGVSLGSFRAACLTDPNIILGHAPASTPHPQHHSQLSFDIHHFFGKSQMHKHDRDRCTRLDYLPLPLSSFRLVL